MAMKTGKLTFRNFRGLDRRNTAMGVSPLGVPSDQGFQRLYGFIKEGVIHPLPDFAVINDSVFESTKLFKINGSLYRMDTGYIAKWNESSQNFVPFITHTFADNPEYRSIKPFFEIVSSGAVSLTRASNTDQSITITTTIPVNAYVNKHVVIGSGSTTQTLYITGNDTNTLYTEGLIDGTTMALSNTINIFEKEDILVVYDGDDVMRFKLSDGTYRGTAITSYDGFIEVFANRLFVLQNHKIIFSTFNSATLANNPFNYIDVEGKIMDKMIIGSTLVVYTTNGTYGLTGTGFTTMNFPKISEFSPDTRIYPVNQTDNTYIIWQGYVRRFTVDGGLLDTQYNYPVIPDTQARIFAIERGIIFPLGHSQGLGLLNVEELQNRKLVSITNRSGYTITDIVEFNGNIFMVRSGLNREVVKSSGYRGIFMVTNNIRFPKKIYRDTVEMSLGGTYLNYVYSYVDSDGGSSCLKNGAANQVSYPIRKMGYSLSLEIDTNDGSNITTPRPISSFTINYKY